VPQIAEVANHDIVNIDYKGGVLAPDKAFLIVMNSIARQPLTHRQIHIRPDSSVSSARRQHP